MRCPDCAKFVGMENGDPEVNLLEVGEVEEGGSSCTVTAEVSLVRNCADCSTELKRADLDTEVVVELGDNKAKCESPKAKDGQHELSVSELSCEATESGGGRYAKNLIGFELDFKVECENEGCELAVDGTVEDALQASGFEESV